ncbi:MAG TPA: LLM class flavin-dependent oxidoreductase [Chloroflexota bacterium]|nr:LLM class flavin-dependent oxidoreductase [Chloroflexota bacterium]
MTAKRPIEFGYNPPTGDRRLERVEPKTFLRDLQHVLDVASQHFSSLWVSDHHMTADRYRLECWTQLTWIAARFPGPRLGTVVMANSYRHPPFLAKMAASLQVFSHGRFILGYGAGWAEEEYRAYGYDFPPARVRIAQMVEGIQVMRALWTQAPATFEGAYYRVKDAYCEPRPDPAPPVMVGGDGERYLLRAVAEHADWWLPYSRQRDVLRRKIEVLKQHCRDVGRDYETIRKAYSPIVYLDRDRAAAERRAGAALERENPAFAGDPAALRDFLSELVDLGFDHFPLVFPNFPETDDMELFVDEVLPAFR